MISIATCRGHSCGGKHQDPSERGTVDQHVMYKGSQDVVLPECASVAGLSLMCMRTAPRFIIF